MSQFLNFRSMSIARQLGVLVCGAVIGVIVGAVASADGDGFDRCMAEKGYHVAQM